MCRALGLFAFLLILAGCNSDYIQKERGYFKIDFPAHAYQKFDRPGFPYTFEYPVYARVIQDSLFFNEQAENNFWINVDFPQFNGRVHLSYKDIGRNRFDSLVRDFYELVYKQHTLRASGIEISDPRSANGVINVVADYQGNSATSFQFFATDSTRHWLRGALYYAATPNADSIKPVNEFLRKDLEHLIQTLRFR